jgi:hypothetical protein
LLIVVILFSAVGSALAQTTTRPILVLQYYTASPSPVPVGGEFMLSVGIYNTGSAHAGNIVVSFQSPDFLPVGTGGVQAASEILMGNHHQFNQAFLASDTLAGRGYGTIAIETSYVNRDSGEMFSENFNVVVYVEQPKYYPPRPTPTPTITPTPTQMVIERPQLVVDGYSTTVDPLQPGTTFNLTLNVRNLGNANAKSVTLVLGGGTIPNDQGTPQPGFSGSADLTNFAPLGSSNLVFMGDISAGQVVATSPQLIVNTNTQPGVYPFKLSYIYTDSKGHYIQDDQVITLLVYALPNVEIGFYRAPDIYFSGQMGTLPIQVTNLGRRSAVLGNLVVTSGNADIQNNVSLVSALEPGGFFTLDATIIPFAPGPLEILAEINYTDDFNMPRTISTMLTINVEDGSIIIEPTPEFPDDGGTPEPPTTEEDFGAKLGRFLLGLLGLDSAPQEQGGGDIIIPPDDIYIDPGGKGIPRDGGKGVPIP